jgi:hypothetical protein
MADDVIPLPLLAQELRVLGVDPPTYRYLHMAAIDCRIPATRSASGRWFVNRADLQEVITALNLTKGPPESAYARAKKRSVGLNG